MSTRRGFLAGILAAGFAPAAIGSGVLMPVRKIISARILLEGDYLHDGPSTMTRQQMQDIINRIQRQMMDNMDMGPPIKIGEMRQWYFADNQVKWKTVNPYR